jgi:hypothetical protein
MNAGKFSFFVKILFVAVLLFAPASLPANADLIIGISFPSQGGGDNDVIGFDSTDPETIDESLLTLPKLHLKDSSWFGVEYRTLSSAIISIPLHDTVFTNLVIPSYSYSSGLAKFNQVVSTYFKGLTVRDERSPPVVSEKGTPTFSATSNSSISDSDSATAAQPAAGILNLSLDQSTLRLDWPADRIGWILQSQTNPGINSQWFSIPGSSLTNHLDLILDRANPSVFFRLIAP